MSRPQILERYIRIAQAVGTLVECVTEADLPARMAAVLSELAQSCAPGPSLGAIAALSASGWSEALRESVESVLASLSYEIIKPAEGQGGYSWDIDRLAAASVGIVWCEHYLAETGSLILSTGPGKGGLASLLPEISIVLSDVRGCLEDLSDYLRRLDGMPPSRITLATGPSRTGDIEATMTTGVHGPGKVVHFILCEND